MKKTLLVTFALMLLATWSLAFTPTPMEISVPEEIIYAFDGNSVEITVDVSGKPARCYLMIETSLPEDQLPGVTKNGYLGWHWINKIDTTVYVSEAYDFPIGTGHKITWDGVGNENTSKSYGGTYENSDAVVPGTYKYTVFAYDNQNPRELVCNVIPWYSQDNDNHTKVREYDDQGMPLDVPLLVGNIQYGSRNIGPPWMTAFRWPLGLDPDDLSQIQTTSLEAGGFSAEEGITLSYGPAVFDPTDINVFYMPHVYTTQKMLGLFKWNWVGDGNATIDETWGGWDELGYTDASRRGMGEYHPGFTTDTNYMVVASPGRNPYPGVQWDKLFVVDFEGNKVGEQMLDYVYTPDNVVETETNAMINRSYATRDVPYAVLLGGEGSCFFFAVDLQRIADGVTENDGYMKWVNGNGDFFLDGSWDPLVTIEGGLWECNSHDYRNPNLGRRDGGFFDGEGLPICVPAMLDLLLLLYILVMALVLHTAVFLMILMLLIGSERVEFKELTTVVHGMVCYCPHLWVKKVLVMV